MPLQLDTIVTEMPKEPPSPPKKDGHRPSGFLHAEQTYVGNIDDQVKEINKLGTIMFLSNISTTQKHANDLSKATQRKHVDGDEPRSGKRHSPYDETKTARTIAEDERVERAARYAYWFGLFSQACIDTCILVCAWNGLDATRSYRNWAFAIVLVWLHIAVRQTRKSWAVVFRGQSWSKMGLFSAKLQTQAIAQHITRVRWFFWSAWIVTVLVIYVGWDLPIWLSIAHPLPEEKHPATLTSLVVHGVVLLILIIPWVWVFLGIACAFSIFYVYGHIVINNLCEVLEHNFAKVATSSSHRPSVMVQSQTFLPSPPPSPKTNSTSISSSSASPSLSPAGTAKANTSLSSSPAGATTAPTVPDPEPGILTLALDPPTFYRLMYNNLEIAPLLRELDTVDDWMRDVCKELSWDYINWNLLCTFMMAVGSVDLVHTVTDPATQLASVFRWSIPTSTPPNDLAFHLCQDLFYVLGGLGVQVTLLYFPSLLTTLHVRLRRFFLKLLSKSAKCDAPDLNTHSLLLRHMDDLNSGYYVFDALLTPFRALLAFLASLLTVVAIHTIVFA
jgi:hypothetical protein